MMMNVEEELSLIENQGLRRHLKTMPAAGGKFLSEDKEILNFSSNDYFDLANDSRLKFAAKKAVEKWGCGACASRLMSGHLELHEELESDLAGMIGGEAALVFGSGFLTNLGVLTALARRGSEIFSDRLNHASLIDGARLSGAKVHRFRHKDMNHLEELLKKTKTKAHKIIVSDSIFSMDGDIAPVRELSELAQQYETLLIIDEAHAIGAIGTEGGGICRSLGVRPDIVVGTMSKALGSYGGFVVCSGIMREFLINRARSFIYSTALPPACLGAARAAVAIVRSNSDLGEKLISKASFFRECLVKTGFQLPKLESQILSLHVGDNERAVAFSQALWNEGILTTAVRPPTVLAGTARLRLSVTLAHTENDLQRATEKITAVAHRLGLSLMRQ